MTTTATANKAGHSGEQEKEKVEKRRALGRGLASLFGGPRVVAARSASAPVPVPAAQTGVATAEQRTVLSPQPGAMGDLASREGAPVPHTVVQQVPYVVRNDYSGAVAVASSVPAVVEDEPGEVAHPQAYDPHQALELPSGLKPGPTSPEEGISVFAQGQSRISGNLVVNVALENIDRNPFQTRHVKKDEGLEELTNSIKASGVLQPILVRPAAEEGRYVLVLGERRMHAAKLAGKTTIPAMVRRVSDQQAAEMTIIENLQREDLSPLEQAEAFRVLSEEFKLTQAQIGERVGLSRESVANYMRLLRLPPEVMQLLAEKKLNFAQAKELLKLEDNEKIKEAALDAVNKSMTVEQVEMLVMRMSGVDKIPGMAGEEKKGGARWVDPNVRAAQMELERLLGVRVRIRDRKGKGKIVIEYSTVDDYERVVGMLRGTK